MSNKFFGTDGMRGHINSLHLQPYNMVKLGQIIGQIALEKRAEQSTITIGRDTRASGIYLEQALIAGISSVGVNCHVVGIMPTSMMAHCTKINGSVLGIMISASHNPYHDNGIKIFDHLGFKISEATERFIEQAYFSGIYYPITETPGKIIHHENAEKSYLSMLASTFHNNKSLKDLTIAVDCAHGAASFLAQEFLGMFGCKIILIGCSPAGRNINGDHGSESPENLKKLVKSSRADLGIAFDGDADRVLFIDEQGNAIDGDAILALMAIYAQKAGHLNKNTMVTTVMSSVALDKAVAPYDIRVIRTDVGDKLVAQKMIQEDLNFGGENSGHLLFFPETTTGDGIFSALKFLHILKDSEKPASKLKEIFQPSPRLLKNISVAKKIPLTLLPKTQAAIEQAHTALLGAGRVMFRYSGTENKARLLIEAETERECHDIAESICQEFVMESLEFNAIK